MNIKEVDKLAKYWGLPTMIGKEILIQIIPQAQDTYALSEIRVQLHMFSPNILEMFD
ncbi:unnamed protein product, partial [Linum tenue]